ncbi:MAG: periplasmic diheme c-type cytochrome, NapB [uncultured Caballeronia sp.]|nr:MAG: periplasmic diheme c-type cytochrome, NapB [uncultured Caballeronia sp.]
MSARLKNAFVELVSISEAHIAGIVVHASQSNLENIKQAISLLPGSEIHATSPEGKIIVTLEVRRLVDIVDQLNAIHALPGVYSASLVYQHHEDIEALARRFAMSLTRRSFIKQTAAATAVSAAGVVLPVFAAGANKTVVAIAEADVTWSKAPCRFDKMRRNRGRESRQGRGDAEQPAGRSEPRPELREGLFPLEDHVRRGSSHHAAAAHEGRQVREGR